MTQQVFAQFIEMSPASLSSIFNGRTKPTLNVVEAIKKKIPDINVEWLMFGTGSMYSKDQPLVVAPVRAQAQAEESLFNFSDTPVPTPALEPAKNVAEKRVSPGVGFNGVGNTHQNVVREEIKIIDKPPRRVTEIRVFYDDQTWESFVPAKK